MSLPHAFITSRYRQDHQLEICQGNERRSVPGKNSAWFELLIGYALAKAGAGNIDAQITARWGEVIEQRLLRSITKTDPTATEVHRTEIDIACLFGARYVVVSCKARDPETFAQEPSGTDGLADVAKEAKAMATLFGRFAVPMMAFYGYNGEPYQVEGVTLFGFQTYTSPVKLKKLIDDEFKRRSTVQNHGA